VNQNPGWLHRVFGTREMDDVLAEARAQLAERDRRIMELERHLLAGRDTTAATERERELEGKLAQALAQREAPSPGDGDRELKARLALASAECAALTAEVADVRSRLTAHESALASEAERAVALGKAASTAKLRAEQRRLEFQSADKQRVDAEAKAAAAQAALEPLEATLAARDRDLAVKSEALTAAEWRIETLERELEQLTADTQRTKGVQQSYALLQRELATQRGKHEQQERALAAARATEASMSAELGSSMQRETELREALRGVIDLSAHALHRTLGAGAHLAIELGAELCRDWFRPRIAAAGASLRDNAHWLDGELQLLGVAEQLKLARDGERLEGTFRLRGDPARADALPLARWVAAYAVEALGALEKAPLRLEAVASGPNEFRFSAAPRGAQRAAAPSELSEALVEEELG
jgi:hypothetical protein